ncbi:MAG: HD domain-containing protein [Clostridia bacterium]|nr:HD domain-containing protein [Clostridia bacterium]
MSLFKKEKKNKEEEENKQEELQKEAVRDVQPTVRLDQNRMGGVYLKLYRWVFSVSLNFDSYQIESGDGDYSGGVLSVRGRYGSLVELLKEKILPDQQSLFSDVFSLEGLRAAYSEGRSYVSYLFYGNFDAVPEGEEPKYDWFEFRAERIPDVNPEKLQLLFYVRRALSETDDGSLNKVEEIPQKEDGSGYDWAEIRNERLINNDKIIYFEYDVVNDIMFTHRGGGGENKHAELREERFLRNVASHSDQLIFHESVKAVEYVLKTAAAGKTTSAEILYRKDGLRGAPFNYYMMEGRPLEEIGKPTWVFGSLKNVDEEVKTRDQNKEMFSQIDAMLSHMYSSMFQIDTGKKVIYHIVKSETGYEREKNPPTIEGYIKRIIDSKAVFPADAREYKRWLEPGYLQRKTLTGPYEFEARLKLRGDSDYRWYSEYITAVEGRQGVYVRMRRDIDDTHKMREQSFVMEEQLHFAEYNRSVLDTMASLVEFRNVESGMHVTHVRMLTNMLLTDIARRSPEMGVTQKVIDLYSQASTVHDIGKVTVPDAILNKPGKYTAAEYAVMKTHTTNGALIVDKLDMHGLDELKACCRDVALHHHERYDGGGYPEGLVGDQISPGVQAVSIADVYDALVNVRCYKEAFGYDEARDMILDGKCGVFNPKMLEAFKACEPRMREMYQTGKKEFTTAEQTAAEALISNQPAYTSPEEVTNG